MTTAPARSTRPVPPFPRRLVDEQVGLALMLWPGFVALVFAIVLTVAYFTSIEFSGWDRAAEFIRLYGFFIGVYVGWSILPLHITHGQTRQEFAGQVVAFVAVFAAAIALMIVLTYLAEALLYEFAGWPQDLREGQFFDSALESHLVFAQHLLVTAFWSAAGVFVASAWYRSDALGFGALILAIFLSMLSSNAIIGFWGPFPEVNEFILGTEFINPWLAALLHIGLLAVTLGLAWLVIRDVPIRNRQA